MIFKDIWYDERQVCTTWNTHNSYMQAAKIKDVGDTGRKTYSELIIEITTLIFKFIKMLVQGLLGYSKLTNYYSKLHLYESSNTLSFLYLMVHISPHLVSLSIHLLLKKCWDILKLKGFSREWNLSFARK